MRDTLKDLKHFENRLHFINESIEEFEQLIAENLHSENIDLSSGYLTLLGYYTTKINCLYSMGAPIEYIEDIFPKYLELFLKTWDKETGSYVQLLWTVSLGILLHTSDLELHQIENIIKEESFHDYLIDYLLHQRNKDWEITTQEVIFSSPYAMLIDVILEKNKEVAIDKLKNYLEKEWYKGHDDAGWHDSHKSKFNTYSGYWSYESGAIAKVLQLDDETLKNVPYYPYDLVHYRN
ncbi:PoNe immunity protein domain-containing protein [Listeria booriae]|uniref:DUF1911 domain-containing protein n=1 Tax=Listeria booriae TaxID=1552123 RepID=A0A7X1DLG2_9LIST|nr:PoNe immunity protein domain-containing protein [Listeria booriae]MBC2285552.1 DUF1911 domain-containing protein [Listeria booriae]MBC2294330.1 DUF1911 domain-containing protein [Listeria booriae]MBC2304855.1 DUF1911 domain-containing protein [Listeria booriae]MBC2311429.1 DUF1911 domain-containing protein [Listeria booriae]